MSWFHSAPKGADIIAGAEAPKELLLEIGRGNVPGFAELFMVGLNRSVPGANTDVWGAGANMVYPTANEQWEILSDDVADTIAGTGAQVVLLAYLDTNYEEKTNIVLMDGTTPVVFSAVDCFRPIAIVTVQAGSNQRNVGNLTLRVAGGGAVRGYMFEDFTFSTNGRTTIPAGKSGLLMFTEVNVGSNDQVEVRINSTVGDNGIFGVTTFNSLNDTLLNTILPIPLAYASKTDIFWSAFNTSGPSAIVFAVAQILLIDD